MKSRRVPLAFTALMLLSSLSGCIFEQTDAGGDEEVLAVFNYSPSSNIRSGDTITFDASSSTPSGGITYRWDFDGDGSIDATGRSTEWSFDEADTYTVELTVSDGTKSSSQTKDVTVVEATAQAPKAEITQYASDEDCSNDDIDETTHIVLWICEMDKSQTDRDISATTTVNLDASDSESGDSSQYITTWNWDLNADVDSDNDGDSENDADLTGEDIEWTNVQPGEYELHLTIENSAGLTDSDSIKVYVSYAGKWSDFEMGGNTSGNAVTLDFDLNVVYDKDNGNTIRKAVGELTYPKIDGDCTNIGTNNCRAKLDVYAFNEEDEEASNTSDTGLDQRSDGDDCDEDDNDCVFLTLSSYMFTDTESTYDDGDWTFQIRNEKINDLQVESFIIRLHYK
ncbi:MAG: PKD domain-containing protein [Candidatus Poseidoniaceae archaeon]|tara:strand:- start:1642 stop:2832 length:1191 start_codon:yes stop_codon:yes gene_type:complete